jgi:hypothetical protein
MKGVFLDLLDPSNDPEFFWQVISGPPCILDYRLRPSEDISKKFGRNSRGSKFVAENY